MERTKVNSPSILLFPWLGFGHVNPFLALAKKLSKMNFHIYFLSTPIILKSIKETLDNNNLSIQLVEFHLPYLHELPPHYHTTNGLPPHLNSTLIQAFQMASSKFPSIIEILKPNLIIYDGFQPWVATMASSCNIHAIMFYVSSTSCLAYLYHQFLYGTSSLTSFPFSSLYLHDYEIKKLDIQPIKPRDEKAFGYVILKSFEQSHNIVLLNTCREIEGKYVDYVSTLGKKELIPIGPLIREATIGEEEHWRTIQSWLDKKDQFSCVYISFGSECFLSKQEIEEIAKGLELSKVSFIWTIKFPKKVNITIEEMVPQGFLERTKGKGMVIEGWAPQSQILKHSSIGGFVNHCGWSSMLESMSFGIPIIAMPMNHDQPFNSRLVEELGIGVEILRGENGEIMKEEVAKGIRKVVEKKTRKEVNLKAMELSEKIKLKGEKTIDEGVKKLLKLLC
ncbi:beta-D-glucosyl crocetin beta-1,6-glucosyltransferase-like [Solanum dulcamara]|uniref:beta-D-glucosyl crocetin beta-1,6-glucosyltransferase-like n=1 Tax=Solanum dulcamara TaxID=45834 RepID=UPI002485955A|nr:beta-D-glucosyl crocetin beta-1,6-glucosyltransferase-like [Solanum dulcamara]